MTKSQTTASLFKADPSKLNWTLGLLSILMFLFFGISKIVGDPASVAGFKDFSPKLGLDPTGFRIFTGVSETGVALLLFASLLVRLGRLLLFVAGYFMTFATMFSGLLIEFFARSEPAIYLVVIAVIFIAVALVQLRRSLQMFQARR